MLDNNIVLWSIRNKTSEKIVRLHHSKVVIVITPWGWHEKSRIQISQKPQQFVGKMKCNTNRDVKATILCLTKTQLQEIRPLEGNSLFCNIPTWSLIDRLSTLNARQEQLLSYFEKNSSYVSGVSVCIFVAL